MSRQSTPNIPQFLQPEYLGFDSIEIVHVDGTIEQRQPRGRPPVVTHWVHYESNSRPDGTTLSFCGEWICARDYSSSPTCPECVRLIQADAHLLSALQEEAS